MKVKTLAAAALASILLAGCANTATSGEGSPASVEPAVAPTATLEPETSAAATSAAETKKTQAETSKRGNLIKKPGDAAGITNAEGNAIVSFTVHSIKVDAKCTGQFAEKAENGHLITLDVSVETKSGVKASYFSDWQMNPYGFKSIAPNGTTSNADMGSSATYSCYDDSKMLPEVGDNESARGFVVLDAETPNGVLVFQDQMTNAAWEWEYPAK